MATLNAYPYQLDKIDVMILDYLVSHPHQMVTAPRICDDLNITKMQAYYRLRMLAVTGHVTLDASQKRNMRWGVADSEDADDDDE